MTTLAAAISATEAFFPGYTTAGRTSLQQVDALRTAHSMIYDEKRGRLIRAIWEKAELASVEGWDGEGGLPANPHSVQYAQVFAASLPPSLPDPDVLIEPDGDVSFGWSTTPHRVVEVVVGSRGNLSFAALLESTRIYGTSPFIYGIPSEVTRKIQQVFESEG